MPKVDTTALRKDAGDFESRVGSALDAARQKLGGAQAIEYSNFTNLHLPLSIVYVEAWNVQNRDLESKRAAATEFKNRLEATARMWDEAEQKSTPKTEGTG